MVNYHTYTTKQETVSIVYRSTIPARGGNWFMPIIALEPPGGASSFLLGRRDKTLSLVVSGLFIYSEQYNFSLTLLNIL